MLYKNPKIAQERIRRWIEQDLTGMIHTAHVPMTVSVTQCREPISVAQARRQAYRPVKVGFQWGPAWSTAWFRLTGKVPSSPVGGEVAALIDTSSEACVWIGDCPMQGLDVNRNDYFLPRTVKPGEKIELLVEAAGNTLFGFGVSTQERAEAEKPKPFTLKQADLAVLDRPVWDLYHDARCLCDLMMNLPEGEPRKMQILAALNRAVNLHHFEDRRTLAAARSALRDTLTVHASDSTPTAYCIGHAHIDVAWLWPLRETIRKCARTFSTVVKYMKEYPEYRFAQSQPQLYAYTKRHYPKLYQKIKAAVRRGQWEPVGGMWVEADCNVTSGESLVRQLLHGKKFFRDEFGKEMDSLWLPDVFGYSAALPQILKLAGCPAFITQKISSNQFNKFPHHTFWWEGIDGTRVLSHFLPANTYNSGCSTRELRFAQKNFSDSDRSDRWMYLYGFGDGGGGPTRNMIESIRRFRNLDGVPKTRQAKSTGFFNDVADETDLLPVWVGELYFELHRGTYTTQAATKRNNRLCELSLRDAEFFSLAAGGRYPANQLDKAWKLVLLNQFHDIIPGSSIGWVYKDAQRDYGEVLETAARINTESRARLVKKIDTSSHKRPIVVFNSLSHSRSELVSAPVPKAKIKSVVGADGKRLPVQIVDKEKGKALLIPARDVPSMGYRVLSANDQPAETSAGDVRVALSPSRRAVLENRLLRVRLDGRGRLTSVFDKRVKREVLNPGKPANVLQLFDDRPNSWDAWDIDPFFCEKGGEIEGPAKLRIVEKGPLRVGLELKREFGQSKLTQRILLSADSARIDFVTDMDWQERCKMLKVAFPAAIRSDQAHFEIQYGHVARPTHRNTSWDQARFEVVGHKWADLAELDYGVAVLNDCKYGYDALGDTLRLTLLRSPEAPDPDADRGRQRFTYSLLPHPGDLAAGGVVRAGYELNVPLQAEWADTHRGALPEQFSWISVDQPNIIVESVKKAEKSDHLIVRLYEARRRRGSVTVQIGWPIRKAWLADLMERNLESLPVRNGKLKLNYKPFQIITLKLKV